MKKTYNNTKYRDSKRLVTFATPPLKKTILKFAKAKNVSTSKEIFTMLEWAIAKGYKG